MSVSLPLHSIWLAGLGALSRSRKEGAGDFEELVRLGHEMEALKELNRSLDRQVNEIRELLADARSRQTSERLEAILENAASFGAILSALEEREAAKGALIEAMLPKSAVPTAPAVLQARLNAAAREALISEFGLLSSAEVAELAGSRAENRAALANRWKQEGRLFTVTHQGETLYPAFQLDGNGQPLPGVAQVLSLLGQQSSDWELALWFTAANGWLGARRPVDLLRSDPAAVAEAARREADELAF